MYKTAFTLAGADISANRIDIVAEAEGKARSAHFDNDAAGHQALCRWLTRQSRQARIVIEATGLYSLDLALALHRHEHIEVMVANPRAIKRFAQARMRRAKSDALDARTICDFARRMPFEPWQPPEAEVLELRAIARRIAALVVERTRERNRLHAVGASRTSSSVVINDIEVNLRHLARRIQQLERQALRVIGTHEGLSAAYDHLTSIRGLATASAVQILPELFVLPKALNVRQWVAYAGLDPRTYESGSSIERPVRISKVGNVHLRRALYMPALVAIKWEPNIKAFYEQLLDRGKKPLVAIVAVMRKLLHAIYGMLKHDADFDGEKFYRIPVPTS